MIARAILVALAFAVTATGVAFSGVAIYLLLLAVADAPAAAALTALISFLTVGAGAAIYLAVAHWRASNLAPPLHAAAGPHQSQDALVTALTELAREHPLMAVACAAALGMTDAMKRKRR
jgi:membrane protease YdiL (CAAX protease family)